MSVIYRSSTVGMPKVKRDKYSVFNFLTIPDSSQASPSAPKPSSSSSTIPRVTAEASNKKSRWDVPVQASEPKDTLSAFLSETRSEVSATQQTEAEVKTHTDPPPASITPEVPADNA